MHKLVYLLSMLTMFSSCQSALEDERFFPEVQSVSTLEKTDFVPTLESSFGNENNIIYGATIPFAWSEIKKEIGAPLVDFSNKELALLNATKSHLNALNDDEYETSVQVEGNEIRAKAYFRKSLPFEEPLIKFDTGLKFGNSEVESFGFWGSCSVARINYFNNESDFSISLFPRDKEHEIILILNSKIKNTSLDFAQYLKIFHQKNNQKIYFNEDDKVEVPIIEFNLEKTFGQLIGSKFRTESSVYELVEAYQRNAFILNENGAEVESEAEFATEESVEFEKPKPKMMIFNRPFVVFLKRKNAQYPYFAVYIANAELLTKK